MHKIAKDLTGQSFGKLKAISLQKQNGYCYWKCICECGRECLKRSSNLLSGSVSTCGVCEKHKTKNLKHGEATLKTREYRIWKGIKSRCSDLRNKNYGGRGIAMCERWSISYESFLSDMGRAPTKKHAIERNNNDGNYEPSNCRWATAKEQSNNRRSNVFIEHDGQKKTLAQWAEFYGWNYINMHKKLKNGKPIEVILSEYGNNS